MRTIIMAFILVIAFIGCSKPSAEEMFKKGEDAHKAEQYDAAIDLYQKLIATYPDSARTPEALYAVGTIYQNYKKSYHQAIAVYRQLVKTYPRHATSPNASFLVGFIYNNAIKNYDSAKIAYEDFIQRYPTDHLVSDAEFEVQNLGKSPEEILANQKQVAQKQIKPVNKNKK
jgi:TolA-binding protein